VCAQSNQVVVVGRLFTAVLLAFLVFFVFLLFYRCEIHWLAFQVTTLYQLELFGIKLSPISSRLSIVVIFNRFVQIIVIMILIFTV
jgi:hypothetical protein